LFFCFKIVFVLFCLSSIVTKKKKTTIVCHLLWWLCCKNLATYAFLLV
jgi:hypothetical protein